MAKIKGTSKKDKLKGTSASDKIYGFGAADFLFGFGGKDKLKGGDGNDTLDGGNGNDRLYGERGNDTLKGGRGNDLLDGGTGRDTMRGGKDNDTYMVDRASDKVIERAGEGIDLVKSKVSFTLGANFENLMLFGSTNLNGTGNDLANVITGSAGNNVLNGGGGNDTLRGGKGNDTLRGGTGNDTLMGDAGNDIIEGGAGVDTLDGGAGVNTLSYASDTTGVLVHLSANVVGGGDAEQGGTVDNVNFASFQNILGGSGNDDLTGTNGSNRIDGGAGNDIINGFNFDGLGGPDILIGGTGVDTVTFENSNGDITVSLALTTVQNTGDAGLVTLSGFENLIGSSQYDTLTGNSGANVIEGREGDDIIEGGAGPDTLDGGDHTTGDTVSYANSASGVTVDLNVGVQVSGGDADGDILSNFENILGSAQADKLTGDGDDNVIEGGDGDDTLDGGSDGANGDTASYQRATSGVIVSLALAGAQNTGGAGTDSLASFENLLGSAFNDTLTGDTGDNVLTGGAGDDVLEGGAGADTLFGGTPGGDSGNDTASYASDTTGVQINLQAGAAGGGHAEGDLLEGIENLIGGFGDDTLSGNPGSNTIQGGEGNDTIQGRGGVDFLEGGDGDDLASFEWVSSGVTISLAETGPQATPGGGLVTLSGFESLFGSSFNDMLTGDAGANVLSGGIGGDDILEGGAGADVINGGNNGSEGDTASYRNSAAGVTVDLSLLGAQVSAGDAAGDTLLNIENLIGSAQADTLLGNDGIDNVIEGGAGADILDGRGNGAGGDTLSYASSDAGVSVDLATNTVSGGHADGDTVSNFENVRGSAHDDVLIGDGNANVLTGGLGADTLTGGLGADTFVFSSFLDADQVTDFVSGVDKIGVAGNLAVSASINFVAGSDPISGAGPGWFLYDTDDGKLFFDPNDSTGVGPQLIATFDGIPTLADTDFFFV